MKMFIRKFGEFLWAQIVVGLGLAGAILWQQIARGLISEPTIKANILAVATPYMYLLGVLVVWHLGRTAFLLHVEDQLEIEGLQRDVERLKPQSDAAVSASAERLAEIQRLIDAIDVRLEPSSGPSTEIVLRVANNGSPRDMSAQCTVTALRIGGKAHEVSSRTFDLKWENESGRIVRVGSHPRNLVIATVDHQRGKGLPTMRVWGLLDGKAKEYEWRSWNEEPGEELPEYDLRITVYSDGSEPYSETFILRPESWLGPLTMAIKAPTPSGHTHAIPPDAPRVIINFDRSEHRDMYAQPLGMKLVRNRKVKLLNRGGDAFHVQIEPINLEAYTVTFESVASLLSDSDIELAPFVERKDGIGLGPALNRDLDIYLIEDSDMAVRSGKRKGFLGDDDADMEHLVPVSVVYCDMTENWYRTRQQLKFDAFHYTIKTELLGYEGIPKPQ